ncbi:predicted protein [Nematostella vectensis]|uniref:EF-hand domain-containing protein n=1 Tax=Nematostella vectensis TaxID=45351 RepID=A7SZ62_NEMVE|nr:predicted protein [Nematostella vectensis]|eukprot:XP_001623106.1 predicted protein [Nematostella vectensis]
MSSKGPAPPPSGHKPQKPEVVVETPNGEHVIKTGSSQRESKNNNDGNGAKPPFFVTQERQSAQRSRSRAKSRQKTTSSKLGRAPTPVQGPAPNVTIYDDSAESAHDSDYDTDLEVEEKRDHFDPTGCKAYREACLELGIVPVSFIMEHITTKAVDIKHHGLGPSGAKAIVTALMNNTTIASLNIRDCGIGSDGGVEVAKLLKENCYITELDVAQNKLKTSGACAFAEVIQDNNVVTSLNLAWNEFNNHDAARFAEALRTNHTLKRLDLSRNKFEEQAGIYLGPAIDANDGLEYLNLSWNHLRGPGAIAFAKGLRANCSLQVLDLSWNGFADEGAHAVGESLKDNNTLLELDLSYNRITCKGALALAEGLKINNTLKVLKIGMNMIQNKGANALLDAMRNNAECAMEKVYLNNVVIDVETNHLIEQILETRPNFVVACTKSKRSGDVMNQLNAMFSGDTKKKKILELINMLKEYVERMNYRLVDLFNQFDKDNSLSVTRDEFYTGLKGIGVPMSDKDLTMLIDLLDEDGDGEIDFSEFTWIREAEEEGIEL